MNDIQILLILIVVAAAMWGYLQLCDRVHG